MPGAQSLTGSLAAKGRLDGNERNVAGGNLLKQKGNATKFVLQVFDLYISIPTESL